MLHEMRNTLTPLVESSIVTVAERNAVGRSKSGRRLWITSAVCRSVAKWNAHDPCR
jgi:hypothetical protein